MTVDVGADELRIRKLLRSRGVGPDAAPATTTTPDIAPYEGEPTAPDGDDQADDEPAGPAKTGPATAPNRTPRIPPWWEPKRANWWQTDSPVGAPSAPAGAGKTDPHDQDDQDDRNGDEPPAPAPAAADVDNGEDQDEDDAPDAPEMTRPAARWSLPRRAPAAPRTSRVRARATNPKTNHRLRVIAFLGTAAGIGASLGLVDLLGQILPYAERSAVGIARMVLALAGAVAAWYVTGLPAVRYVLVYPWLRAAIVLGAAEGGRRLAPLPVAWLNEHGGPYQLAAPEVSLLLTAAVMCGGLYWALDRRAVHLHWTARLVVGVPFASALAAVLLYDPGTTH